MMRIANTLFGLALSLVACAGLAAGVTPEDTAPLAVPSASPSKNASLADPEGNMPSKAQEGAPASGGMIRPRARSENVPHARWAHRPEARLWTRAALTAMKGHGAPLTDMVPRDIGDWCPAYGQASPDQRRAFWVGFMSALAKHESTYRPDAVGGGGLWYGLLQILPATARGYKCRARSGAALMDGAANLSCAIRIMAHTVPRDGVVHGYSTASKRRWRGVSADWGPMRSSKKRADIAGWLRKQSYCKPMRSIRPVMRPEGLVAQKG